MFILERAERSLMKTDNRQISNQITEGVIWKQLLFFFFPILFGTFFQQLYNTTDAVIVGKFVGKEALAAVGGPAATLINLLIGFFTGLSSGATVRRKRRMSKRPFTLLWRSPLRAAQQLWCWGFFFQRQRLRR